MDINIFEPAKHGMYVFTDFGVPLHKVAANIRGAR